MAGRLWTNEETEVLIRLYPQTRVSELAKILNRTVPAICMRASRLKLPNLTEREYHWNWKGGRSLNAPGYVEVLDRDNKNATSSGYILEHRKIMSDHIGRPLTDDECVHHINGVKNDNRIENLKLMTNSEHVKLHAIGRKQTDEAKKKISEYNKERFKDVTKTPNYKDVPILEMYELAKNGMRVIDVCAIYGISHSTYYAKLKRAMNG